MGDAMNFVAENEEEEQTLREFKSKAKLEGKMIREMHLEAIKAYIKRK